MDEVEVSLHRREGGRRREGKVVKILAHAVTELVGTYERTNQFGFVTADNPRISVDIFVPQGQDSGAKTGQKVVVRPYRLRGWKKEPSG